MKFKAFSFYLKGLNVGRRLGHNPPGESTDLQEAQITHIQLCVVQCVCVCACWGHWDSVSVVFKARDSISVA